MKTMNRFIILCVKAVIAVFISICFCADESIPQSVPKTSRVKIGESVELFCVFEITGKILLKWTTAAEEEIFIFSDSSVSEGPAFSQEKYEFSADGNSGNMTILDASLSNDQEYRCKIFSVRGLFTGRSKVEVLVPPTTISISEESKQLFFDKPFEVIAGQQETVICKSNTEGSKPATRLYWDVADNIIFLDQSNSTSANATDIRLQQTNNVVWFLPVWDLHERWLRCQGSHPALDLPLEERVVLDVKVPPSAIILTNSRDEQLQNNSNLTVIQGQPFTLQCIAKGTRPAASIRWFLDNEEILNGVSQSHPANADDSRLKDTISSFVLTPSRDHHGRGVLCRASGIKNISVEAGVTLEVHGPPDEPVIQNKLVILRESQSVEVHCSADNGVPAPTLHWSIGGMDITDQARSSNRQNQNHRFSVNSTLQFTPTPQNNGGELKCFVMDGLNMLEDSVRLQVRYCPRAVQFTSCPSFRDRDSATVTCEVGPSYPASSLTLHLNGEKISLSAGLFISNYSYHSMGFTGVIAKGDYSRTFYRQNGPFTFSCCSNSDDTHCEEKQCKDCTLNIKYAPVVDINMAPTSPIVKGTNVTLVCLVDANPTPQIEWQRKTGEVRIDVSDSQNVTIATSANLSKLVLDDLGVEHAGYYRCQARNDLGMIYSQELLLEVRYMPVISPSIKTLIRARGGQATILTCTAWGNPTADLTWLDIMGAIITSGGEYTTHSTVLEENAFNGTLVENKLRIGNVDPARHYGKYRCLATNMHGSHNVEIVLNGTTYPETPKNLHLPPLNVTPTSLLFVWTPGLDGGEPQSFEVQLCPVGKSDYCKYHDQQGSRYHAQELQPYTQYRLTLHSKNAIGYSEGLVDVLGVTLPQSPLKDDVQIYYIPETGEVYNEGTPSGGSTSIKQPCIKILVFSEELQSWMKQDIPCLEEDAPVKIAEGLSLQYVVAIACGVGEYVAYCSPSSSLQVGVYNPASSSGAIIAVGIVVAIILIFIIIILLVVLRKTNKPARKQDGEYALTKRHGFKTFRKPPDGSENPGPGGESKPFLYDHSNIFEHVTISGKPAYSDYGYDRSPDSEVNGIFPPTGRVVNPDGLIYAEVQHVRDHPPDQPPIQIEPETVYATLDFKKMKEIEQYNQRIEVEQAVSLY